MFDQIHRFAKVIVIALGILGVSGVTGCSTAPSTTEEKTALRREAETTFSTAKRNDPSLGPVAKQALGYAVFPTIGKGAIGVGGAYGKGVLFEGGKCAGYCDMTQASIGFQLGGQAYSEIIFFNTSAALLDFKGGDFAFGAQATAVALHSGAGANAKYSKGVAVFTMDEAGLMYEASIGGQKFSFERASDNAK